MTEVMAAEIEKLIERLEKLTGPDRLLEAKIAVVVGLDTGMFIWDGQRNFIGVQNNITVPAYTSSIDAALTLVRPGTQIEMIWGAENHKAYVELIPPPAGVADGVAATPAIALCIAALRALSHKGASND